MSLTRRLAVFLCLLLVLNEFGPAHFKRLEVHKLIVSKPKTAQGGQKRSFVGKFGSWLVGIFPKIATGVKIIEMVTSIATVMATFINLITECCNGPYSKACDDTAEAKLIQKDLELKEEEIRQTILGTKNLETVILQAQNEFNYTVQKMEDVGLASGELLVSLSSNVSKELKILDIEMQGLVNTSSLAGKKVKYIDLETRYFNVLDGTLGIAVPLFTSIIPAVPKVTKWAKARMGRYKVYELDHSDNAKAIEPPKRSDPRYKAGNSWFGKQASKIVWKVDQTSAKINTRFEKVVKVAAKFKEGIDLAISIVKAAYNVYLLYKTFTKCQEAETKAAEALAKMKEAQTQMNEVLGEVNNTKSKMEEAADRFKEELTSDILQNDLTELKNTLEQLRENTDGGLNDIISSIDAFLTQVGSNEDRTFLETYQLISDLYHGLGSLPIYFKCYSAKANVVRYVLEKCKNGSDTLAGLREEAYYRYETDDDYSNEICKEKIHMDPFSEQQLQDVIDKESQEMGFSRNCPSNSVDKRRIACSEYCDGTSEDKLGFDTETVKEMLEGCTPCEIGGALKQIACRVKKQGKTTQYIFDFLFDHLKDTRQYTLQQVEELDCSDIKVDE